MKPTITGQINTTALKIVRQHPSGIRWVDLNKAIQKAHPDFHPKTINGCVWKLVENFPNQVAKHEKGLFTPVQR